MKLNAHLINQKSQTKKIFTLIVFSIIVSAILISAIWYSVGDVANSFELTFPLNESSVPNHFTLLNVTVNETGSLDIKIFLN